MAAPEPHYRWIDPAIYQSFMGRWSELLAPKFLALAGVPAGARVLDVACGTGVLSKALADSAITWWELTFLKGSWKALGSCDPIQTSHMRPATSAR
jgi:hypothetical protein